MPAASLPRPSRARRPMLRALRRLEQCKADLCRHQCAQSRACRAPPSCFPAPERQEQVQTKMTNLIRTRRRRCASSRTLSQGCCFEPHRSEAARYAPKSTAAWLRAACCVLRAAAAAAAQQRRLLCRHRELATSGFEPTALDLKTSTIPLCYGVACPVAIRKLISIPPCSRINAVESA